MKINITKKRKDILDIELIGKFNIERIQQFEDTMSDLLNKKVALICFNLSQTNYIDSSGLGVLMKTMNLARNKSIEFILYDLSETIDNILRLAHLENFFNIMDKADLEEHIETL